VLLSDLQWLDSVRYVFRLLCESVGGVRYAGVLGTCCRRYCRFKYGKKTEKGRKDGFAGKAKEEWDTKGAKEGNRPQPKPGVRYRGDAK
jgi:hypothetical protein